MPEYSTIVNWHGPIPLADAPSVIEGNGWKEGLYLAVGRHRPLLFLLDKHLQYVGRSGSLLRRVDRRTHEKLCRLVPSSTSIWIGVISSQRNPKEYDGHGALDIGATEQATIFFLRGKLNVEFTGSTPDKSIIITNRWYDPKGKRLESRPLRNWPDLICYDADLKCGHLVWFGRSGLSGFPIEELTGRRLSALVKRRSDLTRRFDRLISRAFHPEIGYREMWGEASDEE